MFRDIKEKEAFVNALQRLVDYWKTQKQTKRIKKLIFSFSEKINEYENDN